MTTVTDKPKTNHAETMVQRYARLVDSMQVAGEKLTHELGVEKAMLKLRDAQLAKLQDELVEVNTIAMNAQDDIDRLKRMLSAYAAIVRENANV
jgi:hypothetical protein